MGERDHLATLSYYIKCAGYYIQAQKIHKKRSFVALLLLLVEKLRIFAASLNNRTTY